MDIPGPDIFLAIIVSLLGVLPKYLKIVIITLSRALLKSCWIRQNMNVKNVFIGAQIIKFKKVRRTIPIAAKKIPMTENMGKHLPHPWVMYALSNYLTRMLNK